MAGPYNSYTQQQQPNTLYQNDKPRLNGGAYGQSSGYATRGAPLHRGATLKQQHIYQSNRGEERDGTILPTTRAPTRRQPSANGNGVGGPRKLTRGKTLTRPDRHIAPAPLINPQLSLQTTSHSVIESRSSWFQPWSFYVSLVTFAIPGFVLSACGMREKPMQRAWREKVALCSICLVLGAFVGFATIGLNKTLCPQNAVSETIRLGEQADYIGIEGWMFSTKDATTVSNVDFSTLSAQQSGQDISSLFDRTANNYFPACSGKSAAYATINLCKNTTSTTTNCTLPAPTTAELSTTLRLVNSTRQVGYSWSQVSDLEYFMVMDGNVLNMRPYILTSPNGVYGDEVDTAIRQVVISQSASSGKDATRLFNNRRALKESVACIKQRYHAGRIDKITPGCFASNLFLYVSLVVILGVVLARFFMACIFSWFLSRELVKPPKNLKRHVVSPAVLPEGANIEVNNRTGTAPWTQNQQKPLKANKRKPAQTNAWSDEKTASRRPVAPVDANGMINMASIGAELFCVCLVTCYSEGEDGIKATLNSIAATDYSDARKLIFIVCDGIVTGSGEKRSTPEICVGMIERDARFGTGDPVAMSYLAVGSGKKGRNEALVYAGHYTQAPGHRTPIIVVVKTGGPEEAKEKKPGNRGKRDGQMILMNFFSHVTYNDRMSPLDYDLFRKTHALMGVTPDFFEVCLMVDADTKIYKDSLTALVNCMQHDPLIMGVCGETRIENKRQSWVTAIQVYEYYISHHLAKGFESVFGGVTCLPGCFSMYRLKARKMNDSDWVPILSQSEIVREYQQSDVESLHQKNLLLLGEDRFLTTIMIRTFPNRKMMFCPQAKCKTVVPDEFRVLLSQRRRWINSTVHNLMELVKVPNLCGTFCFSMQFIVFMELLGTVVLPVAICLTYSLIINYIIHPPDSFADAIPLALLFAVLGLPAILVLITTGKIVYIMWLLIYIAALPVWNFVLPAYSFWHFDDFSWGETRKVAGEGKDLGHVAEGGKTIEVNAVPLRRWEDWERSRLRKLKRDEKRMRDMNRTFSASQQQVYRPSIIDPRFSGRWDAETSSLATSGEDDRYGMQIGQYNEDAASHVPPPLGLYSVEEASSVTLAGNEMAAILDEGWDDEDREVMESAVQYSSHQAAQPMPRIYSVALSDGGAASIHNSFNDSSATLIGGELPSSSHSSSTGHGDYGDISVARSSALAFGAHVRQRSGDYNSNGYTPLVHSTSSNSR